MGKTYLPNGAGAPFKNVIRFVGKNPLDGRSVVDTYSDISGDNYKALFTNEDNGSQIISYYEGMLVVTKDTGKLYVLHGEAFEEVTPDLSNIYGSITATNYTNAKTLAKAENIGQIIYVLNDETSTTEKDDKGQFIVYSKGPYIVTGVAEVAKLGTTTASGNLAGDVATLKGEVATLIETVGDADGGLVQSVAGIDTRLTNLGNNAVTSVTAPSATKTGNIVTITYDAAFVKDSTSTNALQHKAVAAMYNDLVNLVGQVPKFAIEVVDALPVENISTTTVYLLKSGEESNNIYTEYIYVNSAWEYLGKQTLDLSNYVTKDVYESEVGLLSNSVENIITTLEGSDESGDEGLIEKVSDLQLAVTGDGTENNKGLLLRVEAVEGRLGALWSNAVRTVEVTDAENSFLTATKEENSTKLTLSLAIGDYTGNNDGLATTNATKTYVDSAIETAFDWNDVE